MPASLDEYVSDRSAERLLTTDYCLLSTQKSKIKNFNQPAGTGAASKAAESSFGFRRFRLNPMFGV
jgi:hypothetical protein